LLKGSVTYREFPLALTPEEESEGYALACQALPSSDLVISAASPQVPCAEPTRYAAIVRKAYAVARDITHLILELPDGELLAYRPGQYMNVFMPDGSTRSFSMASAPKDKLIDFHIRTIAGGAFSESRLPQLLAGDTLEIELPHGSFYFHAEDYRPLVMVATGTGLAPIKAMLELLMNDPECPPVSLYWGMRTAADLYLHDEIQTWGERLYDFRYVPVLSRPDTTWHGRSGYVQNAVAADLDDLSEHAMYLCGSPRMIFDSKQVFIARGASIDHIYTEGFTFQHSQLVSI
jgi:CDP-4-dehydro-6-deoxyglucose reductase